MRRPPLAWLEILSIRSAPKKMKRNTRAISGGNPHTRNVVIQHSSFLCLRDAHQADWDERLRPGRRRV